jgi:hypothetical protein
MQISTQDLWPSRKLQGIRPPNIMLHGIKLQCIRHIFVPANQNGKPKANKSRHFMKKPQKIEDDQLYRELPI